jgi:hypothetical protein
MSILYIVGKALVYFVTIESFSQFVIKANPAPV